MRKRIVVGITGASGAVYGIRMLEELRRTDFETHLVLSEAAKKTIKIETSFSTEDVAGLADFVHDIGDIAACIASGSFITSGMIVIPCTIKSLSAIANSYADNLITRAADVCLKEGRRLVLVVRETPLHTGHLRLMLEAGRLGATIFPPVPSFYGRPKSVQDIVNQTVGRICDLLAIPSSLSSRWQGPV